MTNQKSPFGKMTLRDLVIPIIKSIDSFNFLLKSHHRRTTIISYHIGRELGLNDIDLFELVVSSGLHDIGALSIQEQDLLIQEDVIKPLPHCIMGHRMLASFDAFQNIAQIIRHHHIKYIESLHFSEEEIPFQSHIINLADRVDVLSNQSPHIMTNITNIIDKITAATGTVFHPKVSKSFQNIAGTDSFWLEIDSLEIDQIFHRIDASIDLNLSMDNIVEFSFILSKIIDFRSHFTATHSYTVAHLASLLGEYFNFSKEKCLKLRVAGYLHDIGKIGINPALIEKPGPLTAEEFNLVKQHAHFTGQILKELNASAWFSEIVTWTERHHEKSDGTGYPYSLDDSRLDVGTKILAFADIISALMEERPYRKKLSISSAFEIIRSKMAPSISLSMFQTIEQHKHQINKLVIKCQVHTFEEYNIARIIDSA